MKGEKGLLLVLIILLAISSLISVTTLRKESRRVISLLQKLEEDRSIATSLFDHYIEVDQFRVKSILDDIGFCLEDDCPHLVMFVPPYPCSICLETEMDSFISVIQSGEIMCSVVGSIQRVKDLRAFSSQYANVSYSSYPLESFKDDYLSDKIFYFFIMDNKIQKVFVTSKSSLFPSSHFFDRIVAITKANVINN